MRQRRKRRPAAAKRLTLESAPSFALRFCAGDTGAGYDLSVAPDGSIYLAGTGELDLSRCGASPTWGEGDSFVARLDAGGRVIWERRVKVYPTDSRRMRIDARHGIGVAFALEVMEGEDFGLGPLPDGLAVGRLDVDGEVLWARLLPDVGVKFAFASGEDAAIAIGGDCYNRARFTIDGAVLCKLQFDPFIVRFADFGPWLTPGGSAALWITISSSRRDRAADRHSAGSRRARRRIAAGGARDHLPPKRFDHGTRAWVATDRLAIVAEGPTHLLPMLRSIFLALLLTHCGGSSAVAPPASPPAPTATAAAPSAPAAPTASDAVSAAVAAPDRDPADRELDAGRKPAEVLGFFGVRPGMRVADIGAGGGYTTELLARIVGDSGRVYGQNSKFILERFAEQPWSARLAKPVMKNVVRVDREFDDPLPPDARELDAVISILFYHDTVWLKTDRSAMNRAIFAALRSGGVYGIVDHAAREGDGIQAVETLHRIEKRVVIEEVTRDGFRLDKESAVLANPSDPRDWNASPRKAGERRGSSDRFVLRFVKP